MCFVHMEDRAWMDTVCVHLHSFSVVLLPFFPSYGQLPVSQGYACGQGCMALSPPRAGTGFGFGFVRSFACLFVFALKFQIEAMFLSH